MSPRVTRQADCARRELPRADRAPAGLPASFGSLELRERANIEAIGQPISYAPEDGVKVPMVDLPSLVLQRLDLLKLDIQGMELDVLNGGEAVIERHRPAMVIETIKSDRDGILAFLDRLGYRTFPAHPNAIAIHESDPTLQQIEQRDDKFILAHQSPLVAGADAPDSETP
jgi:hypothetical protein